MKTIGLDGVFGWDIWASDVKKQMMAAKKEDIVFEISSVGGSVWEAIEIFNLIREYEGKTTAVVMSIALSAAAYITSAADEVKVFDNSMFMVHNPWNFTIGDYRDMSKAAKRLENVSELVARGHQKKTGKTTQDIRIEMDEESWYYGSEIKTAGYADVVMVDVEKEEKLDQDMILVAAKEKLAACFAMMSKDQAKLQQIDLQIMNYFDQKSLMVKPVKVIVNKPKKEKEVKIMKNKEQLKNEYPEVYSAIFEDGRSQERIRVTAHMHFLNANIAIDHAKDAIINGKGMDAEQMAFYAAESAKNSQVVQREKDDEKVDEGSEKVTEQSSLDAVMALSSVKPWKNA